MKALVKVFMLINNWLKDREQKVNRLARQLLQLREVISRVPQGFVQGMQSFIIFLSNLVKRVSSEVRRLYNDIKLCTVIRMMAC